MSLHSCRRPAWTRPRLLACAGLLLVLGWAAGPLAAGAAAASAGAAKPVPTDRELGFSAEGRAAVVGRLRKLAMLPAVMPSLSVDTGAARVAIEESVARHVREAGFEVLESPAYAELFDRFVHQLGGIYDPATGRRNDEKYNAAVRAVQREMADADGVDGFVVARVRMRRVSFGGGVAGWDGVQEASKGRLPGNPIAAFLQADGLTGTLPAWSITVGIVNPEDQPLFARSGGLQLASYIDPSKAKGSSGFLDVADADLFHDPQRIERAVGYATLPLRLSPADYAAGADDPKVNPGATRPRDLPEPPAGQALRREQSPFPGTRAEVLAAVHRVALAPLVSNGYPVDGTIQQRVAQLAGQELQRAGLQAMPAVAEANELLRAELRRAPLYDVHTGKAIEGRIPEAVRTVFPSLVGTGTADALLWLSLVESTAEQSMAIADWDGTTQDAVSLQDVQVGWLGKKGTVWAGSGSLKALSIDAKLWGADGRVLYEARGGVELLQQLLPGALNQSRRVDRAPAELLKVPARIDAGLRHALAQLVAGPEPLAPAK